MVVKHESIGKQKKYHIFKALEIIYHIKIKIKVSEEWKYMFLKKCDLGVCWD